MVIDVGHTPDAVRAALAGFNAMRSARPTLLVCGVSHDKKYEEMIAILAQSFDRIICVSARHKGASAAKSPRARTAPISPPKSRLRIQ